MAAHRPRLRPRADDVTFISREEAHLALHIAHTVASVSPGERAREAREAEEPGERPLPKPQKEEILHPHDFAGGPRIITSRGRAATMHDLSSVSSAPNELAPPALGERERAGSMVALIGDAPTLDGRRRGSTLNTAEI